MRGKYLFSDVNVFNFVKNSKLGYYENEMEYTLSENMAYFFTVESASCLLLSWYNLELTGLSLVCHSIYYVKLHTSYFLLYIWIFFVILQHNSMFAINSFSSDDLEHLATWCCVTQYVDQLVTPKAIAGLNGLKVGGQVLTAVQAVLDGSIMVLH